MRDDPVHEIRSRLFALKDEGYRDFLASLIPTLDKDLIIGVRMPKLRELGKRLNGTLAATTFLDALPHTYYEENQLHGLLISSGNGFANVLRLVEDFLPYIDNWATCDALNPPLFAQNRERLLVPVKRWLQSDHEYTVRLAIAVLMNHFLGDAFDPAYLDLVSSLERDEYYIKMMVAWFFATALSKRFADTIGWIEHHKLPRWSHNKAIQKAIESRVVKAEQKAYLRTLRRKSE